MRRSRVNGRSRPVTGRAVPALLSMLLLLSCGLTTSARSQSSPEPPNSSRSQELASLQSVPADTLAAWVADLTWLSEQLKHDLEIAEIMRVQQVDSLSRRLELANLRLSWATDDKQPWWEPWLLPVAVTMGVVAGAATAR